MEGSILIIPAAVPNSYWNLFLLVVILLCSFYNHYQNPFNKVTKGVAKPSSPISERTKKQLADEKLSEIEAARLEALERDRFEKEKAKIARQDAIYAKQLEQEEEMSASQRETRQEEVLSSVEALF
ncbi:hypothetical protein Tco_1094405 [Tanacetum coccineum]|uniref:ATPase subunit I n=1 Tax=Tanacetum coccineum TaxID=301880 RepID=A0ABQ5IHT6_9ASTR